MATVVVPWRPGCPYREMAWRWVRQRYQQLGLHVVEGTCPPGPWIKALAVADGISKTDDDVLVVADADVWSDGVAKSIEAVSDGEAWAIPHLMLYRLSGGASEAFMAGVHPSLDDLVERPYKGRAGGGIVVLHRSTWEQVPLDPRFQGWGQEDDAWGLALRRLMGAAKRGRADMWHLWHPPQDRISRVIGSMEGRELFRRYSKAKSPSAMRSLLEEVSWSPLQPSQTLKSA